jgi:hypothetical protein
MATEPEPASGPAAALRITDLRLLGTHNSYHVAPDRFVARLIEAAVPDEARAIDCTQRPIPEQLDRLGVRNLELDCYRDPGGGMFATPLGLTLAGALGAPPLEWTEALAAPGIKVLHSPGFDFRTTVPTLSAALREVKTWSDAHPRHVPIFLLLELKSDAFAPPRPLPWDDVGFTELEETILGVFPRERILAPDDLRGGRRSRLARRRSPPRQDRLPDGQRRGRPRCLPRRQPGPRGAAVVHERACRSPRGGVHEAE